MRLGESAAADWKTCEKLEGQVARLQEKVGRSFGSDSILKRELLARFESVVLHIKDVYRGAGGVFVK